MKKITIGLMVCVMVHANLLLGMSSKKQYKESAFCIISRRAAEVEAQIKTLRESNILLTLHGLHIATSSKK